MLDPDLMTTTTNDCVTKPEKLPVPGELFIRKASNADGHAISALVFGILGEYRLEPDPSGVDTDIQDVDAQYHARGGVFEVVEDQGAIVGTFGLYPVSTMTCELRKMYLARQVRGIGLGKHLVARAISKAAELGFRRIELETAGALVEAIGLYRRFGFKPLQSEHLCSRCDQAYYLDVGSVGDPGRNGGTEDGSISSGLQIRPLSDDDRQWVRERTTELFGGATVISRGMAHEPASLRGFIAVADELRIGLATYRIEGASVELVTLDALQRFQGIGSALVEAVEQAAHTLGCDRIWLVTTNDNLDAVRFYQRRGFSLEAVYPNALAESRKLKPSIPLIGNFGIPIRDELVFGKPLTAKPEAPDRFSTRNEVAIRSARMAAEPGIAREETSFHAAYYSRAKAYDVAFSFRNVPAEADFLETVFAQYVGRNLHSAVELMCGPGRHAREFGRRRKRSFGVDLSPEMIAYAQEHTSREAMPVVGWHCQDVRSLSLPEPVDLAYCLMDSFGYLLSNDDIVSHLKAVAQNLNPGGLYVLEMAHPCNFLGKAPTATAENEWTITADGYEVTTQFGLLTDDFDPITEVNQTTVVVKVSHAGHTEEFSDISPLRVITAQGLAALVALSGVFEIATWYGALNLDVPFGNGKSAWRMVPILRRR